METVKIERLHENVHIPFENDERVIGKWEIIGEYNSRIEFELAQQLPEVSVGSKNREIYFLPEGEWYWCYAWTKGKLLIEDGDSSTVNEYVIEKQPDGLYMFVKLKSYDYLQSGRTNVLALRQVDNKHYTSDEIARKDNIDIPFVNDDAVLGKWKAVGVVQHIEEFFCQNTIEGVELYFKEIEFFQNGNGTVQLVRMKLR